ncbi:AAA family ATPase [Pontibacter sp. MBLB2868]|uniref:AAA family ATPase n=1 Tax=Pontibacter sp. MBLB2868 TaxID=3451555 RepID=UPI003F74DAA2
MKQTTKVVFPKGAIIDNKYTVVFFLKQGKYAQSYRVKNSNGETLFLKLINCSKLDRSQVDVEGKILEEVIVKKIKHPNLISYIDSGQISEGNQKYSFIVTPFISGETLADKLKREYTLSSYDAIQICLGVLNGLKSLHNAKNTIIHNELTVHNIMLDLSGAAPKPVIIDFGFSRLFRKMEQQVERENLNPYYLAPECFNGIFTPQSDLYSIGVLLYHLLFGIPPWFKELSSYKADRVKLEDVLIAERNKPLKLLNISGDSGTKIDKVIPRVLKKALNPDTDERFQSAVEFIDALCQESEGEEIVSEQKIFFNDNSNPKGKEAPLKENCGFSQIAGMDELKDLLNDSVIKALQEKELYEEYGLTIPNGMLLYGPPGCGKTFFAEKLAEEVGFNFISIKPSDLASIYVHGSQEKIGKLFNEARENAPSIIFIDELDALLPNREGDLSHSYASEVNEFLAQMSNCSKDGIFVIGATNRPDKIDPAILRTGRLDRIIYLPPPDHDARKAMFELYLKSRPLDFGINYELLADATANYVSSDIEFLINEAARVALKARSKITQSIVLDVIKSVKPSVSWIEIKKHEEMRKKLEGDTASQPTQSSIGFKTSSI